MRNRDRFLAAPSVTNESIDLIGVLRTLAAKGFVEVSQIVVMEVWVQLLE